MSSEIIHGQNSKGVRTSVSVPAYLFSLFSLYKNGDDEARREIKEWLREYPIAGKFVSQSIQRAIVLEIAKPSIAAAWSEKMFNEANEKIRENQLDIEDF